jgi:hypothetical protein
MRRTHLILLTFCVPWSAWGHHGVASFDRNTLLEIEGVVTEFDYRNPHSFVHLRTIDSSGNPMDVVIEAQGSSLRPHGVTPDSLLPGDRVTAVVNPSLRSPDEALGREIIKANGIIVPLAGQAVRDRQANTGIATNLAGVWVPNPAGFTTYVRGPRSWSLTEAARQSVESYDPKTVSQATCIPLPPPLLMLYGSINVVEILDDRVLIHSDWMDAERVIYTDRRSADQGEIPALHGFSVGSWEDDELVVDTQHFSMNSSGNNFGIPSGPNKHLVERFSLADDGASISYTFALEDPDNLSAAVTGNSRWDYRPDLEPDDVACDLESAGRYLNE